MVACLFSWQPFEEQVAKPATKVAGFLFISTPIFFINLTMSEGRSASDTREFPITTLIENINLYLSRQASSFGRYLLEQII